MAAEASKLLKGVDAVALNLAKTALTRDASVSEATNVGKSYFDFGNYEGNKYKQLFLRRSVILENCLGVAQYVSKTPRVLLDKL